MAEKFNYSYYTMRNLIMFHGARFMKNGRNMSETDSLKELESKANLYDEEGWRMLGVLKQLIKENYPTAKVIMYDELPIAGPYPVTPVRFAQFV